MTKIKRAVSFYSLQYEYLNKRMNLGDIFRYTKDLGCEGMEFLPDQMLRSSPHPSDADLKEWDKLVEQYELVPACMDVFLNTNLYKNRTLTKRECIQLLTEEIELANRLGFKGIRLVSMVPAFVIEPLLPLLEKYEIFMDIEIHGGLGIDEPETAEFIDVMKRVNSPFVGVCLDAGVFVNRHPRVVDNYFLALGANPELIQTVNEYFDRGEDLYRISSKQGGGIAKPLLSLCQNDLDFAYAQNANSYEQLDLSLMDELMPYLHHFHFKFYEMTDEGEEYSIDYKKILEYLHKHNYNGFVASEYEGNRWTMPGEETEEKDQVAAHQRMIERYLLDIQG